MNEARRQRWLTRLQEERRLRKAAIADDPEEWYLHQIRAMIVRLLTEPEWCPEPDCSERLILKEAETWLVEQGYTLLEPSEQNLEQVKAELRENGYLVDGRY
jgi:hypothetical protein